MKCNGWFHIGGDLVHLELFSRLELLLQCTVQCSIT